MNDDDDFLGSEDEIHAASGDELDLADTIARVNPVADQLQHFAQMRGVKHALLDRQAPFARINPPSILKGSLGNQAVLLDNQERQVANWMGDDSETIPITVTLGQINIPPNNAPTSDAAFRPFARIQWGTRSSLVTAEVDIGRGCEFTVAASMLTITLVARVGPITPGTPPLPVTLTGMLSFHPIVRTQNVTRTEYFEDEEAPEFRVIPAFSKSVVIMKMAVTNVRIRFFDNLQVEVVGSYFIPAATLQDFTEIPLPGDAVYFVVDDGAGAAAQTRTIFRLDI